MHQQLTVADLPRRQRTWFGPKAGVITPQQEWTYADLADMTAWCRQWLGIKGVGPGDRVVTIFPQTPDFIPWFFALAAAGAVSVPINLRLTPGEVDRILAHARPSHLLVHPDEGSWIQTLSDSVLPYPSGRLIAPDPERLADESALPAVAISPEDPVTILYTSGTTGGAKGCVMSHGSMLTACANLSFAMNLTWHDRFLATLPMFHVGGLVFMLGMYHVGATTVIAGSAAPDDMLDQILEHEITFVSVPFLSALIDRAAARDVTPPSLRLIGWGSQMERSETLRRVGPVLGCEWRGMFGGTETGNVGFITYLHDELDNPGTIGRPVPGLLASVRDIAAAALSGVSSQTAPRPPAPALRPAEPRPAASVPAPFEQTGAPRPATPDIGDLVARASAKASRRDNGSVPTRPAPTPAPQRPGPPPMPDLGHSADRLRTILEEIESAARRAESYRPGRDRR